MNTVLKRLAAMLTAAVMTITQLPATAFAEDILQSAQETVTAEEGNETVPTEEENGTDPTEGENEADPDEEENGTNPAEGENEAVPDEEENATDPDEEENEAVPMADEAVPAEDGYDLWVNGEQFLPEKTTISCGGGSASLYIEDGEYTLALNNAEITKAYNLGAINVGAEIDPLNIELNGNSTVLLDDGENGIGIRASRGLIVWGPGSLTLTGSNKTGSGDSDGISIGTGDLIVNGGTITTIGSDRSVATSGSYGIYISNGNYFQNGGTVTARGGKAKSTSADGLHCYPEAYIRGGTLILEAGEKSGWASARAISIAGSEASLYIKEDAAVKIGTDAASAVDYTGEHVLIGYSNSNLRYNYISIEAGSDPAPYKLAITGDYKTDYTLGEALDMRGAEFTLIMSDKTRQSIAFDDLTTDYDKNKEGVQYVTLTYGQDAMAVSTSIKVQVGGKLNHVTDIRLQGYGGKYPVMSVDPATKQITGDFEFDPDEKDYYIAYYSDTIGIYTFIDHLGDTSFSILNPDTRQFLVTYAAWSDPGTLSLNPGYNSAYFVSDKYSGDLTVNDPVRNVNLQFYKSYAPSRVWGDEDKLDELTEYKFHVYQVVAVADGFSVYEDAEMTGDALEIKPRPSKYGTNVDTFTVTASEAVIKNKKVYIKAPYIGYDSSVGNDVKLYFQTSGGVWTEGKDKNGASVTDPASAAYELDLSAYTLDTETGSYEIKFKLAYEGSGCGIDRIYTLKVNMYDFTPVITAQPVLVDADGNEVTSLEGVDKNELKKMTLSVSVADMPEGAPQGELTYQWYGTKTLTAEAGKPIYGSAIPGQTGATLIPDMLMGGTSFLACTVTRTVNGVAFSTKSDSVKIKVAYPIPYLSPTGFSIEPSIVSVTEECEVGTSPGDFKFQLYAHKGYDSEGNKLNNVLFTPEGGIITPMICRRPAGGGEVELIGEIKMASGGSSAGGDFYYVHGDRSAQGECPEEVSFDYNFYTGADPIPASANDGTYEYFIRLLVTKEGFEDVYSDSDVIATVTFTLPDELGTLEGDGTAENPLKIKSLKDLELIRDLVNAGASFENVHMALESDIALPADWVPMGTMKEGYTGDGNGKNVNPFSAILDGQDHTITVAKGGLPLIGYARRTVISNLKIYGEQIEGSGLINEDFIDYGTSGDYNQTGVTMTATLENITLLSGSKTLESGLATGSGSGINKIIVKNCTVEKGVTVGYTKKVGGIGSFVGVFAGTIEDCVSYADVYGTNSVGGIAGVKNQSMGTCAISRCAFLGTVNATGRGVGGILGKGYEASSAPNTPTATVRNCYVAADITGGTAVGGVFGGETGAVEAWNDSYVTDNIFYGTVKATDAGGIAGGIIGHHAGVNYHQRVSNNFYLNTGAETGFGKIDKIGYGEDRVNPLTFNKDEACKAMTAEQFADGTVLKLLMTSDTSYGNWVQSKDYPVFDGEAVIAVKMELSGTFKTEYYIGDELDLTGLTVTIVYSDDSRKEVPLSDVTVSGFDTNMRGTQTVTLKYGALFAEIEVTVLVYVDPEDPYITVYLEVLGDSVHTVTATNKHTLAKGGLSIWLLKQAYEVDANVTVWDVLRKAFNEAGITCRNPSGNYIESVTYNGVTIGEFTNGRLSGWMYTLNGTHPLNGISQQYLNDGDVIVFHYTDDYTAEEGSDVWASDDDSDDFGDGYSREEIESIYKAVGDRLASLGIPAVGSVGGEWRVIGLVRSGRSVSEKYYDNVVKYVERNIDKNGRLHNAKSTDNSRVILALTALGYDVTDVGGYNLLKGLSDINYVKKQGINGPIWALIALDSHHYEIPENADSGSQTTREKLIQTIRNAQLFDGGWNIAGRTADVDMTAMALQALAPYRSDAKGAIDKAIKLLSESQLDNGAFGSIDGACAESCAQVIVALTALGIDPHTDPRFVKNGRSVVDGLLDFYENGGFKHTANGAVDGMATEQGYYALAAYFRFLNGETSLYDMSDIELLIAELQDEKDDEDDEDEDGDENDEEVDDENDIEEDIAADDITDENNDNNESGANRTDGAGSRNDELTNEAENIGNKTDETDDENPPMGVPLNASVCLILPALAVLTIVLKNKRGSRK